MLLNISVNTCLRNEVKGMPRPCMTRTHADPRIEDIRPAGRPAPFRVVSRQLVASRSSVPHAIPEYYEHNNIEPTCLFSGGIQGFQPVKTSLSTPNPFVRSRSSSDKGVCHNAGTSLALRLDRRWTMSRGAGLTKQPDLVCCSWLSIQECPPGVANVILMGPACKTPYLGAEERFPEAVDPAHLCSF